MYSDNTGTSYGGYYHSTSDIQQDGCYVDVWKYYPTWNEEYLKHYFIWPMTGINYDDIKNQLNEGFVMKKLFEVIIVSLNGDILLEKRVVAFNEEDAKLLSEAYTLLGNEKLSITDVNIIVNKLGDVKIKEKEEKE